MSAFVYLLRCADDTLYTGYTPDIPARLAAHRAGRGAKYTRGRGPLALAGSFALPDRRCALRLEARIKQLARPQKDALLAARGAETLRLARPEDAAALAGIYDWYVQNSAATFAYACRTAAQQRAWLEESRAAYPFLVLEKAGEVLGFACAHRYHEREAFGWCAESTIYLAPGLGGAFRGVRLYGALLALLKAQGVHEVYGVVASPNPASDALHRRLGFAKLGSLPNCGYKLGRWWGTTTWGYTLHEPDGPPAPVAPFCDLSEETVRAVLEFA